jgi:hypothetical protein
MTNKQFQRLLIKTQKAARAHRFLLDEVGSECVSRYGYHYSDLNSDWLIDSLNYGLGFNELSIERFDEEMKFAIDLSGHKVEKEDVES